MVLQCHRLVTPTRLFEMRRKGWHVDAGNRRRHVLLSSRLRHGRLGAAWVRAPGTASSPTGFLPAPQVLRIDRCKPLCWRWTSGTARGRAR